VKNRVLTENGTFEDYDPKKYAEADEAPKPVRKGKMVKSEEVLEKSGDVEIGGKDLKDMTKAELKAVLMEKEIKFGSKDSKDTMLNLLGLGEDLGGEDGEVEL